MCCIEGNWTYFSLLKMFHLSSKSLRQFQQTRGESQGFKVGTGVSLQSHWGQEEFWVSESFRNQNQKQIYCQEGFYTNEEFVLVNKVRDWRQ